MGTDTRMADTTFPVLLDLDGTLVDSVYPHVLAWDEALRDAGHEVPLWRVHAAIGMGGERLVPWLLGRPVPEVAELKDAHERRFLARAERLRPTPGAGALLDDLGGREVPFRVATSATGKVADALLETLGHGELPDVNADAVGSPKPAPDLLLAAVEELSTEGRRATLIGDSPWDAEAAARVGLRMIAVRCGGFSDAVLRDAGAFDVVDDPRALVGRL